jgi:opacity protein-like surface antigen
MTIKRLYAITFVLLVGYVSPANSEYFVGVDYTAFDVSMKNSSVNTGFYGNQQRIRAGYRGDFVGFELDFLSAQDDTNASGILNYEVGPAYGAYMYLYEGWIYGKVGALVTDSILKNLTTGVSDDYSLWQFSAGIGVQFEITKHVFINADYTYSVGSSKYADLYSGENFNITTNSLAAGLTLGF